MFVLLQRLCRVYVVCNCSGCLFGGGGGGGGGVSDYTETTDAEETVRARGAKKKCALGLVERKNARSQPALMGGEGGRGDQQICPSVA